LPSPGEERVANLGGGRGRLLVLLGAAPAVGKTFAMLDEGLRRRRGGEDVAVGYLEAHDRPWTIARARDFEVVPRKKLPYRGLTLEEMDVDAVLARRPDLALVDELAHTNVPGSRNEKRWQDVEELLREGIDVVSTLNAQHLESLGEAVERITGVRPRETVPDAVVRGADEIRFLDIEPEALRRRLVHLHPPDVAERALGGYFRPTNLAALRELARRWLADGRD
jgi:two-component system sensor histidine kinase KdpD